MLYTIHIRIFHDKYNISQKKRNIEYQRQGERRKFQNEKWLFINRRVINYERVGEHRKCLNGNCDCAPWKMVVVGNTRAPPDAIHANWCVWIAIYILMYVRMLDERVSKRTSELYWIKFGIKKCELSLAPTSICISIDSLIDSPVRDHNKCKSNEIKRIQYFCFQ